MPEPERTAETTRVLVVGATGMLGRPVASRLREDGHLVRVLARDVRRARASLGAGFEYVDGDVGDPAGLEKALAGCGAVHVSLKGGAGRGEPERVEHQGTARVAEAATRAGVARITYLSGCYVSPEHAAHSEAEAAKLGAERAIEQSGVPYTIFKPTYFMETLALHVQGPVGVVIGRQPHALRIVAADDYAAMVSRALTTPAAAGKHLFVFGPEAISIPDALRLYCRLVHGGKRVITIPLPIMRAINRAFMRGGMSRDLALMRIMQRVGEPTGVPEASDLLGPAPTTLRQWCERHAQADPTATATSGTTR
jgi:uncharacterized protein YbjT (DUF2867 family)